MPGKLISVMEGTANEYEITQKKMNILPTHFSCFCCDVELVNHQELDAIELGSQ